MHGRSVPYLERLDSVWQQAEWGEFGTPGEWLIRRLHRRRNYYRPTDSRASETMAQLHRGMFHS